MKKGINIGSVTGGSLDDKFKLAKRAGFEGVEVSMDAAGDLTPESGDADVMRVLECARENGIELYSLACNLYWKHNYTANDAAAREKAKEITKRQIQIASMLGCDTILVVPGTVTPDVPYDAAYARALEAVTELAPVAEEYRVNIGVENVWNKFLLSPLETRDFIDAAGSEYVGAYLDVGNIVYIGYPEQWIRILGGRIKQVHFKDYKNGAGFVDLLSGDVDYPAVMKAFAEVGYDGWCTAEMSVYRHYPEMTLYSASQSMNAIFKTT